MNVSITLNPPLPAMNHTFVVSYPPHHLVNEPGLSTYTVPPEFQNPEGADIILRSSDDVDFRTHMSVLSKSSQVFQGMLDIPTPHMMEIDGAPHVELPVVDMTEAHGTLDNILRLCYNSINDPIMHSFEEARDTVAAMTKYEMDEKWSEWMKSTLVSFAQQEPWSLYAFALHLSRIASHFPVRMEHVARSAARCILRSTALDFIDPAADAIHLPDKQRLLTYHSNCKIRLTEMMITGDLIIRTGSHWSWLHPCDICPPSTTLMVMIIDETKKTSGYANAWWMAYLERAKEGVNLRPCGAIIESQVVWMDLVDNLFSTCAKCSLQAMQEMPEFVRLFSQEVDKAAAEVSYL